MKFAIFSLFLLTSWSIALAAPPDGNQGNGKGQGHLHRKQNLPPQASIAQALRKAHAGGNHRSSFVINSTVDGLETSFFDIAVHEPLPAVTAETTFSEYGGPNEMISTEDIATLLVADAEVEEEGTFAIISVDTKTDRVDGIVQKGRKKMKLDQEKGKGSKSYEAPEFTPPAWECGVDNIEAASDEDTLFDRHLMVDHDDHSHHDHDHHSHHVHSKDVEAELSEIKKQLRGSNVRLGKRRRLNGGSYNFQVDVYVEVDQTLVNDNGGIFNPNTINYVNSIFTGANTVYETEIDTHLNVIHIALTNHYDSSSSTGSALSTMRGVYASSSGWHHPGTDIHHALLSKSLGGGVAYLSQICNSNYGFGLSASLRGNFISMDNAVVWDMSVVMHELGHNFGSGHTHDGYSPPVDTCYNADTNSKTCPSALPLAKSATIMSYCHLCSGGSSNLDYTMGGTYAGSGSRSSASNYQNSPLAGNVSYEPRRVSAKMYNHVSTRGSCTVAPDGPSTPQPTPNPTRQPTAPTSCNDSLLTVAVTTDNYPEETSWTLKNLCSNSNSNQEESPTYTSDATAYSNSYCVPKAEYEFILYDSYGDGVCCAWGSGSYKVTYEGTDVATGGQFTSSETTTFGSCSTLADLSAAYDSTLGAPKCASVGRSCTSGDVMLNGRGNFVEKNPPNTIDSCTDGTSGSYQNDESIEKITIAAVGGEAFQAGVLVEIEAKVWAWSTGSSDTADFYYTANVNNPDWKLIGSVGAGGGGERTLRAEYVLPAGNLQAVRVNFRYSGQQSPCSGGNYDDHDDIVFAVQSGECNNCAGQLPMELPPVEQQVVQCETLDKQRCAATDSCAWQNGRYKGCYLN